MKPENPCSTRLVEQGFSALNAQQVFHSSRILARLATRNTSSTGFNSSNYPRKDKCIRNKERMRTLGTLLLVQRSRLREHMSVVVVTGHTTRINGMLHEISTHCCWPLSRSELEANFLTKRQRRVDVGIIAKNSHMLSRNISVIIVNCGITKLYPHCLTMTLSKICSSKRQVAATHVFYINLGHGIPFNGVKRRFRSALSLPKSK